jgi:hypothetical protein
MYTNALLAIDADRIKNPASRTSLPLDAAFDDVRERLNERRAKGIALRIALGTSIS